MAKLSRKLSRYKRAVIETGEFQINRTSLKKKKKVLVALAKVIDTLAQKKPRPSNLRDEELRSPQLGLCRHCQFSGDWTLFYRLDKKNVELLCIDQSFHQFSDTAKCDVDEF